MPFPKPLPPSKPDFCDQYISPQCEPITCGRCRPNGCIPNYFNDYIKVWIPQKPYLDKHGYKKSVIYLHGFALGASEIYESHLLHLVKQGFYVFYPVYQRGFCQIQWNFWSNITEIFHAVLDPFPVKAKGWMDNAIKSVQKTYETIGLLDEKVHSFLFGHSLGGLQALSWPYYADKFLDPTPAQLEPQQILAVNPIPSSDSNIPPPIKFVLNRLGVFENTVEIECTGSHINMPIAILHGKSDCIVPLCEWKKQFQHIRAPYKKLYASTTDSHGYPAMHANHMQASIYTHFLPNWMAKIILGGVGTEDNLNWRYIWSALDQVIRCEVRADQLTFKMGKWSDGQYVKPIESILTEDCSTDLDTTQ